MSSDLAPGPGPGPDQGQNGGLSPLMPVRDDSEATLSALVDALLTKGVYLDLDLIVTVAGIPLMGVSLRAAIAGMETLLEYGMMRDWDDKTRAWARESAARLFPLGEDEDVLARMAGSHEWHDPVTESPVWRPGLVYLTTERLIVFRPEPAGILWETPLAEIRDLEVRVVHPRGSEPASRVQVTLEDGGSAVLTAARPGHLRDLVLSSRPGEGARNDTLRAGAMPGVAASPPTASDTGGSAGLQGELWFREERSSGSVWRSGTASYDPGAGFAWRGETERRPSVRLATHEIRTVRRHTGETPTGEAPILTVTAAEASFSFTGPRLGEWERLLAQEEGHDAESR